MNYGEFGGQYVPQELKEKLKIIISWLETGLPNQEQNNTSALASKNSNYKEPAEADKKAKEEIKVFVL